MNKCVNGVQSHQEVLVLFPWMEPTTKMDAVSVEIKNLPTVDMNVR